MTNGIATVIRDLTGGSPKRKGKLMPQDRDTGTEANQFGKRMALIVATRLGARKVSSDGNEFELDGKRIAIHSAHKKNTYVAVLYNVLQRVDTVLAALELTVRDEFQVWALDKAFYLSHSKPQIKNPDLAQIATKVFTEHGKLIDKVTDSHS